MKHGKTPNGGSLMKAVLLLTMTLLQGASASWGQSWFYYCEEGAALVGNQPSACDSSNQGSIVEVINPGEGAANISFALDSGGFVEFIHEGYSIGGMGLKGREIPMEKTLAHLSTYSKGLYYVLTGARDSVMELLVVEDSVINSYRYGDHSRYKKVKGRVLLEFYETYQLEGHFLWLYYDFDEERYVSSRHNGSGWHSVTTVKMPLKAATFVGDEWGIVEELSRDKNIWKGTFSDSSQSRELSCSDQKECYLYSYYFGHDGDTLTDCYRLYRNKSGDFVRDHTGADVVTVTQRDLTTDVKATYQVVPDSGKVVNWRYTHLSHYTQLRPLTVLTTREGVEVSGKCEPCTKNKCGRNYDIYFFCSYSDKNKKVWGSFLGFRTFLDHYPDNVHNTIYTHGKTSEGTYREGSKVGL